MSASIGYLEVNGGTFKTVACEHHGTAATFYALYAAGEAGKVLCVINDGYFETEGRQTAVLIGNDNTGGDGGINAPATGIVRGGTFVAPVGVPALKGAERTGRPANYGRHVHQRCIPICSRPPHGRGRGRARSWWSL